MGYEADLARGLNRLNPANASDKAWAERQLAQIMEEENLSRQQALALCERYAPTIYRWVINA